MALSFDKNRGWEIVYFAIFLGVFCTPNKEAKKHGIAIIKQVGDTMVIHDADLKVF